MLEDVKIGHMEKPESRVRDRSCHRRAEDEATNTKIAKIIEERNGSSKLLRFMTW